MALVAQPPQRNDALARPLVADVAAERRRWCPWDRPTKPPELSARTATPSMRGCGWVGCTSSSWLICRLSHDLLPLGLFLPISRMIGCSRCDSVGLQDSANTLEFAALPRGSTFALPPEQDYRTNMQQTPRLHRHPRLRRRVLRHRDIFLATAVLMGGVALQVGAYWLLKKPIQQHRQDHVLGQLLLGGMTLVLRNETFIQWKPTIVNWAARRGARRCCMLVKPPH